MTSATKNINAKIINIFHKSFRSETNSFISVLKDSSLADRIEKLDNL